MKTDKEASTFDGEPTPSKLWGWLRYRYHTLPFALELDRFLVRWTRFSIITLLWSKLSKNKLLPCLLLETRGRRSGVLRKSVLPYFRVGSDVVVIGSTGGGPKDPLWVENLRNDGNCWIVGRRRRPMAAHIASPEERSSLVESGVWHNSVPYYEKRAASFGRQIPYVVLSPRRG